jgi:hypothetical protein
MSTRPDQPRKSGRRERRPVAQTEDPYRVTVPIDDPTREYESPLTRSGKGPYPQTERANRPGDPAIGGMD